MKENYSPTTNEKSIAVLPFVNMSTDPNNEYFSDGITEEIINALTSIQDLKVIARTSSFAFKGKNEDIRVIGNKLGVNLILEGSVRKAKSKVRITSQLINVTDGTHFWSENFTRELNDIFALQDEISLLIADKIRENVGHLDIQNHLVAPRTTSIESYELNLKGRYHFFKWTLPDIEKAIGYFIKSIEIAPDYEQPYFSIGLCYSLLGSWGHIERSKAFQFAERYFTDGKKLGKHSVNSHFALAAYQFWGAWNYRQAYQHLQEGHALYPQDPDTLDFMAEINRSLGDFKTAIELNQKALDFNPLSVNAHFTRSTLYYFSGDFKAANSFILKGLQLDPHFELFHHLYCLSLIQLKEEDQLKAFLEKEEISPLLVRLSNNLYAHFHEQAPSQQSTKSLIEEIESFPSPLLYPWSIYLRLYAGSSETALERLSQKVKANMGQVVNFKTDPFLAPLRDRAEYKALIKESFYENSIADQQVKASRSKKPTVLPPEEVAYFAKALSTRMESDQVFTDPSLTLRSLAEMLDLHPNKLSWLLNAQIGKNFSDYVNSYRLKDFQQNALNPQYQHLSLLGLAYESGFNSKSVFNTFFKKQTGMTPKAWIKAAKKS